MAVASRTEETDEEEVLTFGGSSSSVYHDVIHFEGEIRARCGLTGRNPLLKHRSKIETHYDACSRCYPDGFEE